MRAEKQQRFLQKGSINMNNQIPPQAQFGSYSYKAEKRKSDHSLLVIILSIVFSVIIALVGAVFLIITAVMNYSSKTIENYDEVTATIVNREKHWSSLEDKYVTENEIVYKDKEGMTYYATVEGNFDSDTITIYCDKDNYSTMAYIGDLEIFNTVAGGMTGATIALFSVSVIVLVAGIIIGVTMKKRYKARVAEYDAKMQQQFRNGYQSTVSVNPSENKTE